MKRSTFWWDLCKRGCLNEGVKIAVGIQNIISSWNYTRLVLCARFNVYINPKLIDIQI